MKKALSKRIAVITGASEGLGKIIAEHFVKNDANVFICARNKNKLEVALKELRPFCCDNQIFSQVADISNPEQCVKLITSTVQKFGRIDVLVNNAGIHGAKGPVDEIDWEEWTSAIDVNLKGTVLMTRAALPYMKQQGFGKIIMLSGGGATKPMPFMSAYAASKAAVVRFSETLAEEVKMFGIDVNAIAPGALNTRLLNDVLQCGASLVGEKYYAQVIAQKENGGDDIHQAADLAVFLASEKSNGITGKLISAVWDPWQQFDNYRDDLMNTDIYTLRRIVPEERGKNFT